MPKLKIEKQTALKPQDAFQKVVDLFENDGSLKKLDSGYSCEFDNSNLTGTAKGKQFKANMEVKESGDGAAIAIQVELPFHLALAKGVVEKTLKEKLEKYLS